MPDAGMMAAKRAKEIADQQEKSDTLNRLREVERRLAAVEAKVEGKLNALAAAGLGPDRDVSDSNLPFLSGDQRLHG